MDLNKHRVYFHILDGVSYFNISVGDSFDPNNTDSFDPSTFTQCVHVPGSLSAGETRVIQCNQPVRGRYVSVSKREEYSDNM